MTRVPTFVLLAILLVSAVGAGDARSAPLPPPPPVPGVGQVVGVVTSIVAPSAGTAAPAQPSSPSSAARTISISRASDLEARLVTRINAVRRQFGLRPLARSAQLTRGALGHVERLASGGYFSHSWPDGAPFERWIRAFYPVGRASFWSAGENLLWGSQGITPAEAVDAWLASPEHRRNLLAAKWRQIGIGILRVAAAPGVYNRQDVAIVATEFGVRR